MRVPLHSILYADTFRNAVCLHTDAGPLRSYLTFHKFEEQIRDCHNFLSCYRGCMVNMDRIQEATDDGFLLDNGETVQIRKRGSAAIRKAYLQYLFRQAKENLCLKNPIMVLKVCKTTITCRNLRDGCGSDSPVRNVFRRKFRPCLFEENLYNYFLLRSAVYYFWPGSVPG